MTALTPIMARPAVIQAIANCDAPGDVHAEGGEPRTGEHAGGDHGDRRQRHGGGERRPAADDAGAEQLETPLVLLGAGVPSHDDEAEHGGEEGPHHRGS